MAKKKTDNSKQMYITLGIIVLLAAGLAVGIIMAMRMTWTRISHRAEFIVEVNAPALNSEWVRSNEMRKAILATDPTGILARKSSLFTPELPGTIARAYAASPWVRSVRSVSRVFPNTIQVDLELRIPYALFKQGANHYVTDCEGVTLDPTVYLLTADKLEKIGPVISVPASISGPTGGRPWDEVPVREGLAMLGVYREQLAKATKVGQIEIENEAMSNDRPCAIATLVLPGGTRIRWGRTPSSPPSPVEVTDRQKAAAVLAISKKEGVRISRFRLVDVRWPSPLCE